MSLTTGVQEKKEMKISSIYTMNGKKYTTEIH
jgi:hypothetical protein